MKLLNSQRRYLNMTGVIANLENKLQFAIRKSPNLDFKEQKFIIEVLKDYLYYSLESIEENRIMDKKYLKMANKVDYLQKHYHELAQENKKLKAENDYLHEDKQ